MWIIYTIKHAVLNKYSWRVWYNYWSWTLFKIHICNNSTRATSNIEVTIRIWWKRNILYRKIFFRQNGYWVIDRASYDCFVFSWSHYGITVIHLNNRRVNEKFSCLEIVECVGRGVWWYSVSSWVKNDNTDRSSITVCSWKSIRYKRNSWCRRTFCSVPYIVTTTVRGLCYFRSCLSNYSRVTAKFLIIQVVPIIYWVYIVSCIWATIRHSR